MVSVAYIYGTLLVAGGKVKKLNYLFGFGLFVNIILNSILIPRYFAVGAAIATIITQLFVLIGQIMIVRTEWKFIEEVSNYGRLIIFILSSLIVFYFFKHTSSMEWYFMLGFSILICVLLSFILKIIDKKELIGLFKKEIQS
jgi:O-antigen/teichoic acid export membrane protein